MGRDEFDGFWRYSELSEAQQEAIPIELPDDWEFAGTPDDGIEPVFVCPICQEKCTAERGGCKHFVFVYRCEWSSYLHLDSAFENLVVRTLEEKGVNLADEPFEENPAVRPWEITDVDDAEWPGLDVLLPNLHQINFSISHGHSGWDDFAGFLDIENVVVASHFNRELG